MPDKYESISRLISPWDGGENKTPIQQFLYNHYRTHYYERHPILTATGEHELINSFIPKTCPYCNFIGIKKYGKTNNNIQRYRCNKCQQTFTPVTGTIFDGHKVAISEWNIH